MDGFLFGGLLAWALFRVKVRGAKRLAVKTADKAGWSAGLGSMLRFGVMAAFLLLVWRNPRMDLLMAGLGLMTTNAAVVAAGAFETSARVA